MSFLDDLKAGGESVLKAAGTAVGGAVNNGINAITGSENTPRTSNTAPTPDVSAIAARAQQGLSNFASSSVGGISIPLILAAGLVILLITRRK